MKIISINVAEPREVAWNGDVVVTAFFKTPVQHPVRVSALNLDGDRQADLTVHGGRNKAVYVYPSEHYEFWRSELPDVDLPWGSFGENLTSSGFTEESLHIGDRLLIGTAEFVVTQPRTPCFKLNFRFGRHDMVKRFLRSGRSGFYLAVSSVGEITPGDSVTLAPAERPHVTIAEINRAYAGGTISPDLLSRASQVPALPEDWLDFLRRKTAP